MTKKEDWHDPACERFRHLEGRVPCSCCLTAINARTEGWHDARKQILDAAKSYPLTAGELAAVETILQLHLVQTPRDYFFPTVKPRKRRRK